MKIKRLGLVIVLIVLLVIGWGLSIKKLSGVDNINEQKRIIAIGDRFIERGLYIRAIPAYEDVLEIKTNKKDVYMQTEEKLLDAYEEIGDTESYRKLVEKRIEEKTAKEDEYIKVAQLYIDQYATSDGLKTMKLGLENLEECKKLRELYENYRYLYSFKHTALDKIIPTESNNIMPAFDGEKWGFVRKNGKQVIPFIYDEVSLLNSDGHAVVLLDGIYYTINTSNQHWSVNDGDYKKTIKEIKCLDGDNVIFKTEDGYSIFNMDYKLVYENHTYNDLTPLSASRRFILDNNKWILLDEKWEPIEGSESYDVVSINSLGKAFSGGVATVKIDGKWFVIDTEGKRLTEGYIEAKAPESSGYIAVCNEDGKWGYIDHEGKEVIACEYYDALSFSDGLGAVKLYNDEWVYISTYGKQVIAASFVGAKPFHKGAAQVDTIDGAGMIILEYMEDK